MCRPRERFLILSKYHRQRAPVVRRLLSLWNRSGALVSRTKYNSLSTFTWDAMANSILHPLLSHFRISP